MWEGRACGARRELGAFPAEKPTAGVGDRYTGRVIPAGTRSTGSVFRYVPVLASSWPQEPLFGWSGGDSVEGFVVAASLPVDEFNSPGRTRLSVRPRLFSVVGLGYVGLRTVPWSMEGKPGRAGDEAQSLRHRPRNTVWAWVRTTPSKSTPMSENSGRASTSATAGGGSETGQIPATKT